MKRQILVILTAILLLGLVVACQPAEVQEMGVTNFDSLHLSDLPESTATPVLMVNLESGGSANAVEVRVASTPMWYIDSSGGQTSSGSQTINGALTVGSSGSGYDVTFHSGTASDQFLWDASEEGLYITGTAGQDALDIVDGNVDIDDDVDVNGTTNLDDVDIDLSTSLNIDGHMLDVGTCTTPSTADGDNDVCVAGDLEVDNELELDGALDADSTSNFADTATFSKGSGNAIVVSAGGAISANGSAFALAAAEKIAIDGTTANQTQTAGALDIDVGSTTANVSGIDLVVTTDDGTATGTDVFLAKLAMVQDDADADAKGLTITANASTNAAAGSYEYGISYDCVENTATACTDGVLLTSSGVALGMTDGIDASDSNILNALNIGDNLILGGDDSVSIGATDDTLILTSNDSTPTFMGADAASPSDTIYDTTGAGAVQIGSADVTSVNVIADADMQLRNGATGNVDLSFHDYADTTDDDMAHALLRTNCTATGTGAENCDFTIGVAEGGNAADTRLNIDADAGVTIGSANASPVTLTAGTTNAVLSEPTAAGSGGDMLDLAHTFAAMDGSDTSLGIDLNITGADASGTGNLLYGLDADLTTADAQVTEKAIDVSDADWDYAIDAGPVPIVSSAARFMDDFFGDTVNGDWYTELSGTDPQAVQAIGGNALQYGEYQITSGDDNAGGCAASCEGLTVGTHWSADQGSLIFEARVHIDAAVGNDIVCVGLTDDAATVEMPATIAGTTITTNADDALVFCFDTAADTDQWYVIGVANTTDATGNALSGVAPTADIYQVLRIEADAGGADARFYIDGSLVGTLTANAITAADLLTPVVIVDTNADESNVVDVDYIFVSAQRQ